MLAPSQPGGPWLTLDQWESRIAFERFQETGGDDYRSLDSELSHLTAGEHFIGAFEDSSE